MTESVRRASKEMASSSGGETSAKFQVPDSAKGDDKENFVKIICLGDSAVGKSKLVCRVFRLCVMTRPFLCC